MPHFISSNKTVVHDELFIKPQSATEALDISYFLLINLKHWPAVAPFTNMV